MISRRRFSGTIGMGLAIVAVRSLAREFEAADEKEKRLLDQIMKWGNIYGQTVFRVSEGHLAAAQLLAYTDRPGELVAELEASGLSTRYEVVEEYPKKLVSFLVARSAAELHGIRERLLPHVSGVSTVVTSATPSCCIETSWTLKAALWMDRGDGALGSWRGMSRDVGLLSYAPCSPSCRASAEDAAAALRTLKSASPSYAEKLLDKIRAL